MTNEELRDRMIETFKKALDHLKAGMDRGPGDAVMLPTDCAILLYRFLVEGGRIGHTAADSPAVTTVYLKEITEEIGKARIEINAAAGLMDLKSAAGRHVAEADNILIGLEDCLTSGEAP